MKTNLKAIAVFLFLSISIIFESMGQVCTTMEAMAYAGNQQKLDTTKGRGMADNFFLWDVGKTIYIRFINGSSLQHLKVLELAKQWEKYANVKFQIVSGEPSNVRVRFSDSQENYSQLGINSNMMSSDTNTMHLEYALFADTLRLKRTVVHEFGHVLGFMHEHSSPISGIQWNKDTMYTSYAKYGWDKDMVDAQIFKTYNQRYTNGTNYDAKSIMHYPIPAWQTSNGYNVGWNTEISDGDKQLAALMYPFTGARVNEVPRIYIQNYTNIVVKADQAAGGINIYPSFEVKTEGVMGTVYFAVLLFDKDGNAIKATSEKYNVNGCVGTYKAFRMAPDKLLNANKNLPDDFPLFIPFDNIPKNYNNEDIQVQFRTFVSDGEEMKSIYFSAPISYKLNMM
jgi:hypothetical protein